MAGREIAVFAPDHMLNAVHLRRKKFHRTAAPGAHHVMVATAVVLALIAGDAVMKCHHAGQAAIGQQLERAIDRRETNLRIFLSHQLVQFVGRQVLAGLQKCAYDGAPLGGMLQPDFLKVTMQNVLGFAHHLARNRRPVINTFLRHDGHVAPENSTVRKTE